MIENDLRVSCHDHDRDESVQKVHVEVHVGLRVNQCYYLVAKENYIEQLKPVGDRFPNPVAILFLLLLKSFRENFVQIASDGFGLLNTEELVQTAPVLLA